MNYCKRFSVTAAAIGLVMCVPIASAAGSQSVALKDQAKITETDARATALAQAPGGTVQSAELEIERGKLVWSFDIKRPNSANGVEVQVDAKTGAVVSKKIESPADQAKEAKADKKVKS